MIRCWHLSIVSVFLLFCVVPDVKADQEKSPALAFPGFKISESTQSSPPQAQEQSAQADQSVKSDSLSSDHSEENKRNKHQGWNSPGENDGKKITLNERPLTEDEIKQKVAENNQREKRRVAEEKARHQQRQVFVPQASGYGKSIPQRQHHRRPYSFNRHRRAYFYPEVYVVRKVLVLPSGFELVRMGGKTYYYANGLFYQQDSERYVNVPPPVGVLVTSLSSDYIEITVGGVKCWTYNGLYYKKTIGGYQVMDPPSGFEDVQIEQAPKTINGEEAIVVNFPDPQVEGQFIEIKLIRSAAGFLGPQGESYPEFPPVEQLKVMYGQ